MDTPTIKGYWYLAMVKMTAEVGTANPIMACVEGIPYSSDHFCSSWTTGGMAGLGHLIMSFNPCPIYMTMVHNSTSRLPTEASRFQNQRLKNRAQNGSSPSWLPKRKRKYQNLFLIYKEIN